MMEGWEDFYLLVGSAAAALIGLLFVVVTLTTDFERGRAQQGQSLYMTPIVFHLAVIFLVSAAAMVPRLQPPLFALIAAAAGLVGLAWSMHVFFGIRGPRNAPLPHWSDPWCYGLCPALAHGVLVAGGIVLAIGSTCGARAIATAAVALLLACIRNAWDLVTWLAPRADGTSQS